MIHVITGPPCSGKSTYVREHCHEGDICVDYDMIAICIGATKSHHAEGHIKDCAFAVRETAIDYLLKNPEAEGWVIHSFPKPGQIDTYKAAGADFIELDTDMATCLERAEADGRPERTINAIHSWFERKKGARQMIKTKTYELNGNGTISGYASTWTREPDSYGDVVAKGAFTESIEKIKAEGKVLPLLFNHSGDDLKNYIGTVINLEEDDHGLKFDATFDDTEEAQRARELAASGRLVKFSFAYDVIDQAEVELEDGRKANELRKLNIHEVSLVLYPANPDTSIVSIKSESMEYVPVGSVAEILETKSGRRNSAKDAEDLRKAISLIQGVLGELDDIPEDDSKAKAEEPDTVNAEEQTKAELLERARKLLTEE